MNPVSLPPETAIGTVHLRVADLEGMARWYEEVLGFEILADDGATAALGARRGRPLLVLHGRPGAPPPPRSAVGLFHVAFLLPDRRALGGMMRRVMAADWPFDGYADHNVSEAAYLRDPEDNGLELYADRSPDVWRMVDGQVFITTEPLDVPGVLLAAPRAAGALPEETVVGHIHLRVASLAASEAFYHGRLGFGVVSRRIPGALFMAAGDYHHHVGCNVWGEPARPAGPDGRRGLMSYEVIVPSESARRALLDGSDEGLLVDPDQNGVRIVRR
ncbi:MAG: VOC family protein [Longimicrobiales bacterium]